MQNTKTEYSSSERTPVVLPEMEQLLPPLSGEQFSADWFAFALASMSGFSRRAIWPNSHLSRLRRPFWGKTKNYPSTEAGGY